MYKYSHFMQVKNADTAKESYFGKFGGK